MCSSDDCGVMMMLIRDSDIKRDDDEEEQGSDEDEDEDASFLSGPLFLFFFENFFPLFSLACLAFFSLRSIYYSVCPSLPVFYFSSDSPTVTPLTCLKKRTQVTTIIIIIIIKSRVTHFLSSLPLFLFSFSFSPRNLIL